MLPNGIGANAPTTYHRGFIEREPSDLQALQQPDTSGWGPVENWSKQQLLVDFQDLLSATDSDELATVQTALRRGLLETHAPANQETSAVGRLFKNRSYFSRECTRSGSLALAAFAFKTFGTKLLENSNQGRIDKNKLLVAMQLLFGKEMPRISGDLVTSLEVQSFDGPDGTEFNLRTKGYFINVSPVDNTKRQQNLNNLINKKSVNPSFFYNKPPTCLTQLFMEGDQIPAFLVHSLGLKFQESPNLTGEQAARAVARLAAEMNPGDIICQTERVKMSFIAPSNPSNYRKVSERFGNGHQITVAVPSKTDSAHYILHEGVFKPSEVANAPQQVVMGSEEYATEKTLREYRQTEELRAELSSDPLDIDPIYPFDPMDQDDPLVGTASTSSSVDTDPDNNRSEDTNSDKSGGSLKSEEPGIDIQDVPSELFTYNPASRAMNAYKIEVADNGQLSTFYGLASQNIGTAMENAAAAALAVKGIFDDEPGQDGFMAPPQLTVGIDDPDYRSWETEIEIQSASDPDSPDLLDLPRVNTSDRIRYDSTPDSSGDIRKMDRILLDIRLNSEQFESDLYTTHKAAMQTACENLSVTYLSVLQECHSELVGIASSVVAGLQPEGLAHPFTSGPGRDTYMNNVVEEVLACYQLLPRSVRAANAPVLQMWQTAMRNTEVQTNATPLVLSSQILSDVFQINKETTRKDLRLSVGCKSAKDRTPAIVMGVVMAGPLIRAELEKEPADVDLNRIMSVGPAGSALHYDALDTNEKLLLADSYDPSLMHAVSIRNTGVATNLNERPLKEFAREVDFVAQDYFYTVSSGGY